MLRILLGRLGRTRTRQSAQADRHWQSAAESVRDDRVVTDYHRRRRRLMTTKTAKPQSTDRIETRVEVSAPRARVWRAITSAKEFGTWFGVQLDGEFAAGATVRGKVTIKGYEHLTLDMQVGRIEPERYFSD